MKINSRQHITRKGIVKNNPKTTYQITIFSKRILQLKRDQNNMSTSDLQGVVTFITNSKIGNDMSNPEIRQLRYEVEDRILEIIYKSRTPEKDIYILEKDIHKFETENSIKEEFGNNGEPLPKERNEDSEDR